MTNTVGAPASGRQSASIKLIVAVLATSSLAGCGETAVCSKQDVLNAVYTLWQQQQFHNVYDPSTRVVLVQDKTATDITAEKDAKIRKCSVLITVDLAQMVKVVQNLSDAEIEKQKAAASAKGVQTSTDNLVNYTVQTMNDGQHYITVLP